MNDLLAEVRAENLAKANAARKGKDSTKKTTQLLQATISGLDASRRSLVEARASQIPERSLRAYVRAIAGKSLRSAVTAFCSECVGYSRKDVRNCTSLACPLWSYRPFQKPKKV